MLTTSRRLFLRLLPGALLALALATLAGPRTQEPAQRPPDGLYFPRTIVVVRHAEKAADDPTDPTLTEEGTLRAVRLARTLGHAGVTHLFASEFRRTRETLLPLATALGTDVHVVPARDPRALLSALRELPRNSVAVVAGHSNTVPALIAALAPDSFVVKRQRESLALNDDDYDRLFVVTQWAPERGAGVLELRY